MRVNIKRSCGTTKQDSTGTRFSTGGKKKQYEDLLHKYIHLFTFSYKDLREVTME